MLPARRCGLFSFLLSAAIFLVLLYGQQARLDSARQAFADWIYDPDPPVVTATCGASNIPLLNGGECNGAYAKTICTDPSPASGCHSITHTDSSGGSPYVVNFSGPPYPANTSSQPVQINSTGGTVTAIATDGAGNNSAPFTFTFSTCQIELGAGISVEVDTTLPVTATLTQGTVDSIDFAISGGTPAGSSTVSPSSDSTSPYITNVTGVRVTTNPATLTASGIVGGETICSDTTPVTVTNAQAWWQVEDGDVLASGSLTSSIPSGCTSPSCNPTFNLDGNYSNGYPGVTIHNGSASFGSNGSVADPPWLANSPYNGPVYDYDWFEKLVPSEAFDNPIESDTIGGSNLSTGGYQAPNGYVWRYREGNLTINSVANLGTDKIILLVKGGNLTIRNDIKITEGSGFFAAIVQGDIILDSNVSHPSNPSLMGIYMADNQFKTGVGSGRLIVKGSVVGWGRTASPGIVLERDLEGDNSDTPGETIIYDPGLSLTFPRELMRKGVTWKEIAP